MAARNCGSVRMPVTVATVGAFSAFRRPEVTSPSEVEGGIVVLAGAINPSVVPGIIVPGKVEIGFTVPGGTYVAGFAELPGVVSEGWVPPDPMTLCPPRLTPPRVQLNPRALLSFCVNSTNLALMFTSGGATFNVSTAA